MSNVQWWMYWTAQHVFLGACLLSWVSFFKLIIKRNKNGLVITISPLDLFKKANNWIFKTSHYHSTWWYKIWILTLTSSLKRKCLYFSSAASFLSTFRAISSPIKRLQFIHSIPGKNCTAQPQWTMFHPMVHSCLWQTNYQWSKKIITGHFNNNLYKLKPEQYTMLGPA